MLRWFVLAFFAFVATLSLAHADVFNMGGTRNPTTGVWTGAASVEFVTVGDPGNVPDSRGYGGVDYTYRMGKYDVTVGQYCEFLNAVAKTDTYELYNSNIATAMPTIAITRIGSSGNYSYSVTGSHSQAANCPIFSVSWGDAARFCNWLQNGQPVGPQGLGTTETGAYTLNGAGPDEIQAIQRNAGAQYFLPSEDEWHKAAYYKGGGTNAGYWYYPTKSNSVPSNSLVSGTNNANFYKAGYTDPTNYLTPVGAFALSPGPFGTFDMGGELWQWNEANYSSRGLRGGSWAQRYDTMGAACLNYFAVPGSSYVGFRVASVAVPEPSAACVLITAALCSAAFLAKRRR